MHIIFWLFVCRCSNAQDVDQAKNQPDADTEIEAKFGHTSKESEYLRVWENQCLKEFMSDLKTDNEGNEGVFEYQEGESSDLAVKGEKLTVYGLEWYKNTDVVPFVKNLMNQESMGLFDMNFKGFFFFMYSLAFLVAAGIVVKCIFCCSILRTRRLKYRPVCYKCCNGLSVLLVAISLIMLVLNLVWLTNIISIQQDLKCEATRVPHTLFFGNPEIYFKVSRTSNFIGFETFNLFLQDFLSEVDSFTQGDNFKIMKELQRVDFHASVQNIFKVFIEFTNNFRDKESVDTSGSSAKPRSIDIMLPIYKSNIQNMLDEYQVIADRVKNISLLMPLLENPSQLDTFKHDLSSSSDQLKTIQIHLSMFWNQVLRGSFDSAILFQTSVILLSIFMFCLVLLLVATQGLLLRLFKCFPNHRKKRVRFLAVLGLILIFLICLSLFEISRGIYTSVYGCSFLYQMRNDPFNTKTKIEPYLKQNSVVDRIFNECYFEAKKTNSLNFFSLLDNDKEQHSMQQYVDFLDSIKLIHDDFSVIDRSNNKYFTESYIGLLKDKMNGVSFDFDGVEDALRSFNESISCANIAYALTSKSCGQQISNQETCLGILENEFTVPDCVSNKDEAELNFSRLKEYISRETDLINEMLVYLEGPRTGGSILSLTDQIASQFEFLDRKVRSLDSNLHSNLSQFSQGSLKKWLDCGVIQNEIAKTFNNVCDRKTEDLLKFTDLNFGLLVIGFISVSIMFVATFCLTDSEENGAKFVPGESRKWQDMSDVFDNSQMNLERRESKTVTVEDVEIRQFSKDKPVPIDF